MINENKLIFLSWNAIEFKYCTTEEFMDFFLWVDTDFFSLQFSKKDRYEIPLIFEGYQKKGQTYPVGKGIPISRIVCTRKCCG